MINKRQVTNFLICGTILAMVFSPFFLTLGMILLVALSLINWKSANGRFRLFFDRDTFSRLSQWRNYPALISFIPLFLLVLFSVWGMDDVGYWMDRLRIRLPFLLLPLLFIALPAFRESEVDGFLYFLLSLLFITGVMVVIHYWMNMEAIQLAIERGQAIPMPRSHIRFSMLLALATIGGAHLSLKSYTFSWATDRWLIPGMTGILFLIMHLLAVRTGLFALYAAIFVLSVRYALVHRRYALLLLVLLGIVILPIVAYQLIPSLKAKIDYVRYDYWKHQRGEGGQYADSGRIASLQVGWDIFREHPIIGTGAGGLRPAVNEKFASTYPQYPNPLMPHSQYLYVAAATGIMGLSIFMFAFFFPLFYQGNYRYPPLLGLYAMLGAIFVIEHSLENSLGAGYAAFFLLIFLSYLQKKKD